MYFHYTFEQFIIQDHQHIDFYLLYRSWSYIKIFMQMEMLYFIHYLYFQFLHIFHYLKLNLVIISYHHNENYQLIQTYLLIIMEVNMKFISMHLRINYILYHNENLTSKVHYPLLRSKVKFLLYNYLNNIIYAKYSFHLEIDMVEYNY